MSDNERYQTQVRLDEHLNNERLVAPVTDFLKGMTPQEINAVLAFAIQLKIGGVQPAFFKLMADSFENLSQPRHTEGSKLSGEVSMDFSGARQPSGCAHLVRLFRNHILNRDADRKP